MEFAITKISTKGQIVIPRALRKNISTGDEFLMVKDDKRIILKSISSLASGLKQDVVFAEKVEKAWQEHDKGKFREKTKKEFLKELKSC